MVMSFTENKEVLDMERGVALFIRCNSQHEICQLQIDAEVCMVQSSPIYWSRRTPCRMYVQTAKCNSGTLQHNAIKIRTQ